MKHLAVNVFICAVVFTICFWLGGELRHPSRETLTLIAAMSIGTGLMMWLWNLQQNWLYNLAKPRRDEDQGS